MALSLCVADSLKRLLIKIKTSPIFFLCVCALVWYMNVGCGVYLAAPSHIPFPRQIKKNPCRKENHFYFSISLTVPIPKRNETDFFTPFYCVAPTRQQQQFIPPFYRQASKYDQEIAKDE